MTNLAPLMVVVPLGAAAAVLFANSLVPARAVRALTGLAVLVEVGLGAALVHQTAHGLIVYWFGGWTPRSGVALGVAFSVDQLGAGAALLAALVIGAAVATAWWSMPDAGAIVSALLLTLLAAMAGFCLTGDIFNLFVFFELMAVSAFALAAYRSGSRSALRGTLNFAVTNSIGAFLVLIGIALLYGRTGALNLAQIGRQLARDGAPDRLVIVALALLLAGFLIKAAVVPFHFWLIDLAASGPVPLIMILAGVVDALGLYGAARIYWTVFATPMAARQHVVEAALIGLGALSALGAGALSVAARAPRRRLAFVMVAHTGIVLAGLGCLSARGTAGAVMYAAGDGSAKAAILAGLVLLGMEGAAARKAGRTVLVAGGLACAGLPLFATGVGKAAIEDALAAAGYAWVTPVVVLTAALTGAAVLHMALTAAPAAPAAPLASGGGDGGRRTLTAVAAALLGVSVATVTLGRWAASAAARFVGTAGYQRRGAATTPASARAHPPGQRDTARSHCRCRRCPPRRGARARRSPAGNARRSVVSAPRGAVEAARRQHRGLRHMGHRRHRRHYPGPGFGPPLRDGPAREASSLHAAAA
jgi:multicomponent Na+:H+ antiporter subunit D